VGDAPAEGSEKIQKVLAGAGFGSRRELEGWIEAGRVRVNGAVATLGDRLSPGDELSVDGRPVRLRPAATKRPPRVLRYHKAAGEVCTRRDPEGRATVFERLPGIRGRRWIAVGRLDLNTSGLILFTDDGELAHRLMHPSTQLDRAYAVRVYGSLLPDVMQRLTDGVTLEDGEGRFLEVSDEGGEGRNHWYRVVVREGRNRLVRRMWESQGVEVSRLVRVAYAGVELPRRLRAGRWDELDAVQVKALMAAAGMVPRSPPPATPAQRGRGKSRGGGREDEGRHRGPRKRS
jgi:23S rRNA pseudouridine2605 synthase